MFSTYQKPLLGSQINWQNPISKGMIGCYLLNENGGNYIYNSVTGIAAPHNCPWVPGGLNFVSANSPLITLPDFYANVDEVSILMRITLGALVGNLQYWYFGGVSPDRLYIIYDKPTTSNKMFGMRLGNNADGYSSSTSEPGETHTVVLTAKKLTKANLYVDGVNKLNYTHNAGNLGYAGADRIGNHSNPITPWASGVLHSLQCWNRALSAQEVAYLYSSPYDMFERRPIWQGYQATSDTTLTVNDSAHALSSDNVTLELTPSVTGTVGKNTDGWCGAVPVYMTLDNLSHDDYPYARAKVVTAGSQTFYVPMAWSSGNSRFEGVIYPGSNLGSGLADPTTGTFTITVQLDNNADFGSIAYSGEDVTFSTVITRRWPSSTANVPTAFIATYDTDHWNYVINDFSVNAASAQNNVAVAIPFYPTTAAISNIAVTFDGAAVSGGSAASESNAWWWDTATHTLYIQFASLDTTYVHVDIAFDSDTDLFATRIDRYSTEHIYNPDRLFYNGLIFSNRYIVTAMFGGGFEGAGEQVDMQGTSGNVLLGLDCMERVAIHVDDTKNPDSSGYYTHNIKWKQTEWAAYITAQDNNSFTVVNNSDNTATTGWKPQLDNGVAVVRTQTFYAGERYIRNQYQITNGGESTRKYSLVWGREQWIDSAEESDSRATNDRGRFAGDASDRAIECSVAISSLSSAWMVAYDNSSFGAMGIIFQVGNLPDNGYFLTEPPITTSAAEWPIVVTDKSTTENANSFFDKSWATVAASASVSLTFWQWGGAYFDDWAAISAAISADYAELNPVLTVADAGHALTSEVPALTQAHTLAVADAGHALTSEVPVLTEHKTLEVSAADHVLTSDNVEVETEGGLEVTDGAHALTSEAPALVQQHVLTIADAAHSLTSDNPALVQAYTLAVNDSAHLVGSDGVVLTQAHYLALLDALHSLSSDNIDLLLPSTLIVSGSAHVLSTGSITLTVGYPTVLAGNVIYSRARVVTISS